MTIELGSRNIHGAPDRADVPELRAQDRCDRSNCGARALVITMHAGRPLYWCAHHYTLVEGSVAILTAVDHRNYLTPHP